MHTLTKESEDAIKSLAWLARKRKSSLIVNAFNLLILSMHFKT